MKYWAVNRFVPERFTYSGERSLLESLEKLNLKRLDQFIHLRSEGLVQILLLVQLLFISVIRT